MKHLILCLLVVTGCTPFSPEDATRFTPPPQFETWWVEMEQCSGKTGDYSNISWFVVDGESFETPDGNSWGWWTTKHEIYIARPVYNWTVLPIDSNTTTIYNVVVKHEMLHDLIGHEGHPSIPFQTPCNVMM